MNIAEWGTMDILENVVEQEEPTLVGMDIVTDDESLLVEVQEVQEAIESEDRDGDAMAAARPSGYNKTEHDDAVGKKKNRMGKRK